MPFSSGRLLPASIRKQGVYAKYFLGNSSSFKTSLRCRFTSAVSAVGRRKLFGKNLLSIKKSSSANLGNCPAPNPQSYFKMWGSSLNSKPSFRCSLIQKLSIAHSSLAPIPVYIQLPSPAIFTALS